LIHICVCCEKSTFLIAPLWICYHLTIVICKQNVNFFNGSYSMCFFIRLIIKDITVHFTFITFQWTYVDIYRLRTITMYVHTIYVVSFDGWNFCGQGLPNIFAVKFCCPLVSCRKSLCLTSFWQGNFYSLLRNRKTPKILPIETSYVYGIYTY